MENGEEQFSYQEESGQVAPFVYDEGAIIDESPVVLEEPAQPPMFEKAMGWLLSAAAFLLPLWFLPVTFDVLDFNKQILLVLIAVVGLVFYLVDMIRTGFLRFRSSQFYWAFAGLGVAGVVATIFSVSRWTSIFGSGISRSFSLISIISFGVLFFLAINYAKDSGKSIRNSLTLSLSLTLLLGVLQMLGVKVFNWVSTSNAFNTVGPMNTLAGLAAASIVFFSFDSKKNAKADSEPSELSPSVWFDWLLTVAKYGGLVLAFFIIILINWWPVWTVAFISLLVSVAFGTAAPHIDGQRKFTMKSFAMPMAVIVIGIFLMLINFNWVSLKSKLPIEVAPAFKTSSQIAFDSVKIRPLGFGLENFSIAYDKFKPAAIVNSVFYRFRFVDSTAEIFNMAAEGGVLMVLAFLSLLWFYWKEISLFFKNKFFGNSENAKIWASSTGLLAMFFLFPINMTIMSVFVLMLALATVQKYEARAEGTRERVINLETDAKFSFIGSLVFIIGLVLVLVTGYFTVNNFMANSLMAKAAKATDANIAIDNYVKSINSNAYDDRAYGFLAQTLVTKVSQDLDSGPAKDETRENYNAKIQNTMASAIDIALRETNVNPANSQNWANRGLIYQSFVGLIGGAEQAAIEMYTESLNRNPFDPQTYLNIGNVYLSSTDNLQAYINNPPKDQVGKFDVASLKKQIADNLEKAKQNFEKAVSMYGDFGQALYNLAVVYERQNKVPEAIKNFEKLQTSNQQDPSILFQLGLLYYKDNQKDKAIAAWERSVLLFPNYSNARWYLSLAYEEKGEMDKALAQAEEVLKLNPDNEAAKTRVDQLKSGQTTIPTGNVSDQKPI